jgi:glutamate N-acetyltransferase/amino-acid N-acetyltransferase
MKIIEMGILAPKGYKSGSVASGIKKRKLDMTIITSDLKAVVAGAFTSNIVKAAPVVYDELIVNKNHPVQAILINSGNANACTGAQGDKDVLESTSLVAEHLNVKSEEVLMCSTGVIGVPLPMEKIKKGIHLCTSHLGNSHHHSSECAKAILTTDTFTKEIAVEISIDNTTVRIGGIAKGSGMIHPNMATMLSFITTDAQVDKEYLQNLLGKSISTSYNMISVDGDTSTNDTVLVLANGASGAPLINAESPFKEEFEAAFTYVHTELAKMIVKDGEGASKFIEVNVNGSSSKKDAALLARSIISSSLVKTAFFGSDANWGRILCAMGYSGAKFDPLKVTMKYESDGGEIVVMKHGEPIEFDEVLAKKILTHNVIYLTIELNEGNEMATAWGCDLSYDYVKINGDYRS